MHFFHKTLVVAVGLCLCLTGPAGAQVESPDVADIYWSDQFARPGIYGKVNAMVPLDNDLVVGGEIWTIDGEPVHNVARWDGVSWQPMGSGLAEEVADLIVYHGELFAAGRFGLARWDGSDWSDQSVGSPYRTNTLTIHRDTLFAAGSFWVKYYDAGDWHDYLLEYSDAYDFKWNNRDIYDMVSYNDMLVISGRFTDFPREGLSYLIAYQESQWVGLGDWIVLESTPDSNVLHLAVSGNELVVAGDFATIGGVPAEGIAKYDGVSWAPMGNPYWDTDQLHAHDGKVYRGVYLGTLEGPFVEVWDGTQWQPAVTSAGGNCTALMSWNGQLAAAGLVNQSDNLYVNGINFLAGQDWQRLRVPVGKGMNNSVNDLIEFDGQLIATGLFSTVSGLPVEHVAAWDGNNWQPMGMGIPANGGALTIYNDELYTGLRHWPGSKMPPGLERTALYKWAGSEFVAVGIDMYFSSVPSIEDFTEYDGKLVVAGGRHWLDEACIVTISLWDGIQWEPLCGSPEWGWVHAVTVFNGDLIAAGDFDTANGQIVNNIMRYDGVTWHTMGDGFDNDVNALYVYQNELYAGGDFSSSGATEVLNIARWDGNTWVPVGQGLPSEFSAGVGGLGEFRGGLLATGAFGDSAGLHPAGAAIWYGDHWASFGSGIGYRGQAIAEFDGDLYLGGSISTAGGKSSWGVAQWTRPADCCAGVAGNVDNDPDNAIDIGDITALVDYLFVSSAPVACPPEANVDGDAAGTIDVGDVTTLIGYIFLSGPPPAACY